MASSARLRDSSLVHSDVLTAVPRLAARMRAGAISPAMFTALYVLHWQLARHGRRFAQRRSRRDDALDGAHWCAEALQCDAAGAERLADRFERYNLRGVSPRVNSALSCWLRGQWNITLCQRIPSALDVLQMQAEGARPVTAIAQFPRMLQPVLDKTDAFAFVCHDLEHAWQYFHDPAQQALQQRFARRLRAALAAGVFRAYLDDSIFAAKFDYLAADMNTHVVHSLQYLRAIMLDFHLRRERKSNDARVSDESKQQLEQCLAALLGSDGAHCESFAAFCRGSLTPATAAALESAISN